MIGCWAIGEQIEHQDCTAQRRRQHQCGPAMLANPVGADGYEQVLERVAKVRAEPYTLQQ
jgi:hypothetical protein